MKKNLPLTIGLSIPVLMIVFIAASIYLPRFSATQPQFSFLYTGGSNYNTVKFYTVKDNKLFLDENPNCPPPGNGANFKTEPRLFRYDAVKDQSQEISFESAQTMKLDSNIKSPDGFELSYNHSDYFPFFFLGRDYQSKFLKKGNFVKKINTQTDPSSQYNYFDFRFLAWVIGENNGQTGTATATH